MSLFYYFDPNSRTKSIGIISAYNKCQILAAGGGRANPLINHGKTWKETMDTCILFTNYCHARTYQVESFTVGEAYRDREEDVRLI